MAAAAWGKDRRVWLPAAAILIAILGAAYFVLFKDSSPWKKGTVAYDPTCKADCQKLSDRIFPHVGPIKLQVQPKLDDEIAQWGDCLQSVASCLYADRAAPNRDVKACVASAACPQSCKDRYVNAVGAETDVNKLLDAFEAVFVNQGAPCAARSTAGQR